MTLDSLTHITSFEDVIDSADDDDNVDEPEIINISDEDDSSYGHGYVRYNGSLCTNSRPHPSLRMTMSPSYVDSSSELYIPYSFMCSNNMLEKGGVNLTACSHGSWPAFLNLLQRKKG